MEYLRYNKLNQRFLKHLISAPFIYAVFFAFIFLDILLEIYHRTCFPLYWLDLVDRKKYIKFDRHKLPYLDFLQKFNCFYCSYWNWLLAYASEIAGQTEKYWCWIQHQKTADYIEQKHHKDFVPYWDEKAFYEKYHTKEDAECKLLN